MVGLKIVNVDYSQKFLGIMRIMRLINDPNSIRATVFNSFISQYVGFEWLFKCYYNTKLMSHIIPQYFKTILLNWINIKIRDDIDNIVRNNCNIQVDLKVVFNNRLLNSG